MTFRDTSACCAAVAAVVLMAVVCLGHAAPADAPVRFSRDVLPILAENCYQCHGPDAAARKAKMRLDTKEGVFSAKPNGIIPVVPGKPDESEMIVRVFSTDPDEVMPDPASHKKLTDAQKNLL